MANGGHGPAAPGADLERLARQYWDAWQDALQRTMPGGAGAVPGFGPAVAFAAPADPWRGVLDWWTRQAVPERAGFDDLLSRFNGQAGGWFAQMQQLASRFAGQDASPDAVVGAWRDMLGGASANPFATMLGNMQGPGLEGWERWAQRMAPLFDLSQGAGRDWSQLPTMGLTREHQERWQGLARAFADYQRSQQGFQGLLLQASQGAFAHFERRLRERDPAQPIDSARALFDLWIDAAEDAYADVALSPPFRTAYADMVAGQMRLRQAVQREIEQLCRLFDLPTRSELDGAHRKVADLERALRRLRDRVDAFEDGRHAEASAPSQASAAPPRTPAGPTHVVETRDAAPARAVQGGRGAVRKASTATAKRAPSKRAAVKKVPSKKAMARGQADAAPRAPARASKAAAKTRAAGDGARSTPAKKAAARKTAAKKTAAKKTSKKRAASGATTRTSSTPATDGAVPKGTATAAATTRRDAVAGTTRTRRPTRGPTRTPAKATSRRGPSRPAGSTSKRAVRAASTTPSRVGTMPNFGFVSPIPEAPEPMKSGTSGRRKR